MTAEDDDAFWLYEADPQVDICDPTLTVDACLDVILPEIQDRIAHVGAVAVEIGCGIGRLTNPMQALHPAATVIGIDINPRFIDAAVWAARKDGLKVPTYVVDDGLGYCRDGEADAVYSMCVFQHIDNDRKRDYIAQVGRVLRPGGVFRFQYVEGAHSSRCMYDALIGDVRAWCVEAGLTVQRAQHDLLMPRWTWVTATREAA